MTPADLIKALEPLTRRVRTDVTAVKGAKGQAWTDEALTPARLRQHLNGGPARGVCPIKAGEDTTSVGLLDFDSHKGETPWPEMQAAASKVMDALRERGLSPVPWRSSGGRGVHVYALWDSPQDAYTVRQVLTEALTAVGFTNGPAGVQANQVEVFPKQDSVPAGGYGNQFILPLAGESEPLDALELEPLGRAPDSIVWPISEALAKREKPVRERVELDIAVELAELRSALEAIPNSGEHELDYDQWRNAVFAIHSATDGSDEGRELAHEFSGKAGKYDPEFLDNRVWPYAKDREAGVTVRTVYAMAREHGWNGAQIPATEFDVVDTAKVEAEARAADAAKPSRFTVITDAEFMARPAPRWIVKGLVPEGDLLVLFGESGAGKSFVALDLFGAVARGVAWRGLRVRQRKVCFVVAEGGGGFRNRLHAYTQHHGTKPGVSVIHAAPNLMEKAEARDVAKAILAAGGADIVVVDTFAQTTPGANENAGEHVGKALAHCREIGKALGGALVVLVHHTGKDTTKGARGWSGLRAAADAEIEVSKVAGSRKVRTTKQKDGDDTAQWGFSLEQVPIGLDEDDDIITSCVVVDAPLAQTGDAKRKLGPREELLNEAIQELAKSGAFEFSARDVVANAVDLWVSDGNKADKNTSANFRKSLVKMCGSAFDYAFDATTDTVSL